MLTPDQSGIVRSVVFPGFWLDVPAMLGGDLAAVFQVVDRGLASLEHAAFVRKLRRR